MSRIRTTRQARALRERVMRKRRFEREMLAIYLRHARSQVEWLRGEVSPERRLRMEAALAYWESAVDALEDDGVMPERKGAS